MILQALKGYYDRKAADPDGGIAPLGFEWKEIPFVIVIDEIGSLVQIEDARHGDGKKKQAKAFLVPQGIKKTSGVAANLLWDVAGYVLGIDTKGKPERVIEQQAAFASRLMGLPSDDSGVRAVKEFLARIPLEKLAASPAWEEVSTIDPVMTFRLQGDQELVCQRPAVIQFLQSDKASTESVQAICLVSGETTEIERLHPAIKGVWGAQTSGANIVSFNQRSFESYGKEQKQGENAPVGKVASFAYTTALNHLLGKDSSQRIQVGDASTVFWADAPDELETGFLDLFGEPSKDDPDRNVKAVESLYRSVETGSFATDSDTTRFFVLGLAPNAARISVRFWQTGTVAEFAGRIRQHFDDLKIDRASYDSPYLSLFRLLVNTATLGKADNIPPNIAGDIMRAILAGLPYPATLLQAAVRRIRAEQEVNYVRAALIKACLNRASRYRNQQEDITVSLDTANPNPAYRLGRLFAVLEKIQEAANPGLNATIRDRFYGAASSSPVTVFANLMKLKNHHLAKLSEGYKVFYEKLIGEIMSELSDFPTQLPLAEQGRFAIGYYHQQRAFYTKTEQPQPEQGA
ncbi:MAG: type I-C CRISPR-associated protein Cas8c/Csd1 [Sulfuricella sp.]